MESWIQVDKTSGSGNGVVKITLEPNTLIESREGTVDVKTSTLNKVLSIIQKGVTMNFGVTLVTSGVVLSPEQIQSAEESSYGIPAIIISGMSPGTGNILIVSFSGEGDLTKYDVQIGKDSNALDSISMSKSSDAKFTYGLYSKNIQGSTGSGVYFISIDGLAVLAIDLA